MNLLRITENCSDQQRLFLFPNLDLHQFRSEKVPPRFIQCNIVFLYQPQSFKSCLIVYMGRQFKTPCVLWISSKLGRNPAKPRKRLHASLLREVILCEVENITLIYASGS